MVLATRLRPLSPRVPYPNAADKVWYSSISFSGFILLFIYLFLKFYYSYVHTRLGSFLPPAPTSSLTTYSAPSLSLLPLQYPAEIILPLFLILL
jgi:hypothetical protein